MGPADRRCTRGSGHERWFERFRPDLSPDATQIAYSSQNERPGVYIVPSFGGDPKLVLPDAYWPRFSPTGIAYCAWVQTKACVSCGLIKDCQLM